MFDMSFFLVYDIAIQKLKLNFQDTKDLGCYRVTLLASPLLH